MKKTPDYEAGWTTPTINPKTLRRCAGGAARSLRLKAAGGASGVYSAGFNAGLAHLAPLIEKFQRELRKAQIMNVAMMKQLEALSSSSLARGRRRT